MSNKLKDKKFRISIKEMTSIGMEGSTLDIDSLAELKDALEKQNVHKVNLKYYSILDDTPNWHEEDILANQLNEDHFTWLIIKSKGDSRFLEIISRKSREMSKEELQDALKTGRNRSSIILPEDIGFRLKNNILTISISTKAIFINMQGDQAAFEAWTLIFKRWVKAIQYVIIKWEEPVFHFTSFSERQHYQRFLFRVLRFSESYNWVNIDSSNRKSFNQLVLKEDDKYVLNSPSKKRKRDFKVLKGLSEYSESQLEEFILSHDKTLDEFKNTFELVLVDNQLPVGVFFEKKTNSTRIFTGGKSAIDIWGINKNNEVCVFELKNSRNNRVGALSEVLFYAYLIREVINKRIKYNSLTYPGLQKIQCANKVNCYLLAPSTHPLIDKEIFIILNNTTSGILYRNIKIVKRIDKLQFV